MKRKRFSEEQIIGVNRPRFTPNTWTLFATGTAPALVAASILTLVIPASTLSSWG
jgi:hypothetical protein